MKVGVRSNLKKKPNVAIIGLSPLFERSWVDTKILDELSRSIDLEVFLTYQRKTNYPSIDIQNFFSKREKKIISILRNMAWITYRKRSPSFQFWLKRYYFSDYNWLQRDLHFFSKAKYLLSQIVRFVKIVSRNRVSFWFFSPVKKIGFILFKKLIYKNQKIVKLFSKFDLVIIHSSSNEVFAPIIINSLRKSGTKTLMTIENWDNLTSKQVLFERPNYVSVMGPMDHKHAMRIHGFKEYEVFPIGLPKFEFLRHFKREIGSKFDELNLLYIGFHLPHDEIGLLNQLYKELKNRGIEFKLQYRPHPNARKRLAEGNLNSDIYIVDTLELDSDSGLPLLNESYLQDILKADLVLGPPTTLIVECMLLNIPCLLDVTSDSSHRTTSGEAVKKYLHLQDFYSKFEFLSFKNVKECTNLISDFNGTKIRSVTYSELDNFVSQNNSGYASGILNALYKILNVQYAETRGFEPPRPFRGQPH
jgi:hypothetical protein